MATEFVLENSSTGSLVGITALAEDLDGTDVVTYSLDHDDEGRFAIDSGTGVVFLSGSIDRESHGANRLITVRATSTDGSFSTRTFTIALGDVNEFSVTLPSDASGGVNAIAENSGNGSLIGITAGSTDSDATNNLVTYTLDDNAGGRFAINSVTGVVTVADGSLLNYETSASHEITVRASSGDGSFATETFVIAVLDVNEAPVAVNNTYQTSFIDDLVLAGSGILGNDFDPDGNSLTAILVSGPLRGTLLGFLPDGKFWYRPETGFVGTVELSYLVTDGILQSNIATVRIVVAVPDNVPNAPSNSSSSNVGADSAPSKADTTPVAAPVATSEATAANTNQSPAAIRAVEQLPERAQGAAVVGPEATEGEAKGGVLVVSLSSGSNFDLLEVQQTRFEHFESHYERFTEESLGLENREMERRDRASQEQSDVQFSMDSALVRTVIGSGVVLMVMQGAQLAATLVAVNPTLMQFDPLSVMSGAGRGEKKELLTKGEKLFDK
jgi:hypothetical protein